MMGQDWGSAAATQRVCHGDQSYGPRCHLRPRKRVSERRRPRLGERRLPDDRRHLHDGHQQGAQANPSLADSAVSGLAGKMDPATQSIAASQELKTAAQSLQASGIENPTVLDTRGYYNFGAKYGAVLAQASDNQNMAALMPTYSAKQLAANGVTSTHDRGAVAAIHHFEDRDRCVAAGPGELTNALTNPRPAPAGIRAGGSRPGATGRAATARLRLHDAQPEPGTDAGRQRQRAGLRQPSASSPKVGNAAAVVIATSPLNVVHGFGEVLFPNGRQGWIEAKMLRPYANASNPNAHCTPSLMSNGRPGFG